MSPEVIKGDYNEKTDIWSVGVTTFFVLTGRFPFNAPDKVSLFRKISNLDIQYNDN